MTTNREVFPRIEPTIGSKQSTRPNGLQGRLVDIVNSMVIEIFDGFVRPNSIKNIVLERDHKDYMAYSQYNFLYFYDLKNNYFSEILSYENVVRIYNIMARLSCIYNFIGRFFEKLCPKSFVFFAIVDNNCEYGLWRRNICAVIQLVPILIVNHQARTFRANQLPRFITGPENTNYSVNQSNFLPGEPISKLAFSKYKFF